MGTRLRVNLVAAVPVAVTGMMLLVAGCASSAAPTPAAATPSRSATATVAKAPLRCHASVTTRHPADYTTVGIRVRTAPHARISTSADFRHSTVTHGHRANRTGRQTIWYQLGAAKLGYQVMVNVSTSRHGRKGYCGTWFTPPRPPRVVVPTPPAPAPSSPAPATSAASCHPLSDSGTCYEPGEFCRESDQGVTGVAGDGETITCEDNNGLRWEPS